MKYKELRNILCAAAAKHKTIEAFVTFTQDSFPALNTPYLSARISLRRRKKRSPPAIVVTPFLETAWTAATWAFVWNSTWQMRRVVRMDGKPRTAALSSTNCWQPMSAKCASSVTSTPLKEANRAMWEEMADAVNCMPEELYDFIQENEPAGECGFGVLFCMGQRCWP